MRYPTVIMDPPWPYEVWSADTGHGRSAEAHYATMTWRDIERLGPLLDAVTTPNAALALWVCPPSQDRAIEIVKSWGWRYITKLCCWVKLTSSGRSIFTGMGHYTRANSEDLLLFVKHPTRAPVRLRHDVKQVVITLEEELHGIGGTPTLLAPVGRHSAKPDEVQDAMERLFVGPYLEVFARRQRPNWRTIGNEIDGKDIRTALRDLAAEYEVFEPAPEATHA